PPPKCSDPPTAAPPPCSRPSRRPPPRNRMYRSRASPRFLFWQACTGHALGAKTPLLRRLWQEWFHEAVLSLQTPVFAVIKSAKAGPCPFPKQGDVDTYPSRPMASARSPSQEASGRDRSAPSGVRRDRFGTGFSKAAKV